MSREEQDKLNAAANRRGLLSRVAGAPMAIGRALVGSGGNAKSQGSGVAGQPPGNTLADQWVDFLLHAAERDILLEQQQQQGTHVQAHGGGAAQGAFNPVMRYSSSGIGSVPGAANTSTVVTSQGPVSAQYDRTMMEPDMDPQALNMKRPSSSSSVAMLNFSNGTATTPSHSQPWSPSPPTTTGYGQMSWQQQPSYGSSQPSVMPQQATPQPQPPPLPPSTEATVTSPPPTIPRVAEPVRFKQYGSTGSLNLSTDSTMLSTKPSQGPFLIGSQPPPLSQSSRHMGSASMGNVQQHPPAGDATSWSVARTAIPFNPAAGAPVAQGNAHNVQSGYNAYNSYPTAGHRLSDSGQVLFNTGAGQGMNSDDVTASASKPYEMPAWNAGPTAGMIAYGTTTSQRSTGH